MWRELDLENILAEEERVPVVFNVDAAGLGALDPNLQHVTSPTDGSGGEGSNVSHLRANSRVEVPLWLAMSLAERNMVTIELPRHYDRKMRDAVAAGASSIRLREFSPYFFEVGSSLASHMGDLDLADTVRIAFSDDRYRELMVQSLSSAKDESGSFIQELTVLESELYHAGVSSVRELEEWRRQRRPQVKKFSLSSSSESRPSKIPRL